MIKIKFENAKFEASYGTSEQIVETSVPEIVFSGRSNVGKSSLINKLVNRKSLARVSAKPGKTGTINFYSIDDVKLVDLPGYGYAQVSNSERKRWSELVEGYFNDDRNISLVVQLVDMRHSPTKDDMNMINYLSAGEYPFVIALTKSDKLNKSEREKRLELLKVELQDFEGIRVIPFSTVKPEGVEELKSLLEESVKI